MKKTKKSIKTVRTERRIRENERRIRENERRIRENERKNVRRRDITGIFRSFVVFF